MVDQVWSCANFARVTRNERGGRALFRSLDNALKDVHAAPNLAAQLPALQTLVETITRFQDRERQTLSNLPRNSVARARRHGLQVHQLGEQAKAALERLKQEREDRFSQNAARLITEQSHVEVKSDELSWHQAGEPLPSDFIFEFALHKATTGAEVKAVLSRLSRAQFPWLAKDGIQKLLDKKLQPEDAGWFATFAISAMLVPPDGSTDNVLRCIRPTKVRPEVLRCLSPMVANKAIALELLKKQVQIVVIPRNRHMTDLPMFAHLKDNIVRGGGRVWNSTRGVGDVSSGGKPHLACTEENLLGHVLDSSVHYYWVIKSGTCPADHTLDYTSPRGYYTVQASGVSPKPYDEGYSTTTHEFAHIIHRQAMGKADKDLLTLHINKWSRGMTQADYDERVFTLPTLSTEAEARRAKLHRELAMHRIEHQLKRRNLSDAEKSDLADLMIEHLGPKVAHVVKKQLSMGWEWVDGAIGITEDEKARRRKAKDRDDKLEVAMPALSKSKEVTLLNGKKVNLVETERPDIQRYFQSLPTAGSPVCYASSHVEEWFAQLSCCWLETNGGEDPYIHQPRKNSQQWVRENEPRPIVDLLERLYGTTTLPNTNPLSKPL